MYLKNKSLHINYIMFILSVFFNSLAIDRQAFFFMTSSLHLDDDSSHNFRWFCTDVMSKVMYMYVYMYKYKHDLLLTY